MPPKKYRKSPAARRREKEWKRQHHEVIPEIETAVEDEDGPSNRQEHEPPSLEIQMSGAKLSPSPQSLAAPSAGPTVLSGRLFVNDTDDEEMVDVERVDIERPDTASASALPSTSPYDVCTWDDCNATLTSKEDWHDHRMGHLASNTGKKCLYKPCPSGYQYKGTKGTREQSLKIHITNLHPFNPKRVSSTRYGARPILADDPTEDNNLSIFWARTVGQLGVCSRYSFDYTEDVIRAQMGNMKLVSGYLAQRGLPGHSIISHSLTWEKISAKRGFQWCRNLSKNYNTDSGTPVERTFASWPGFQQMTETSNIKIVIIEGLEGITVDRDAWVELADTVNHELWLVFRINVENVARSGFSEVYDIAWFDYLHIRLAYLAQCLAGDTIPNSAIGRFFRRYFIAAYGERIHQSLARSAAGRRRRVRQNDLEESE
ncbi:MAG: hypothetical protein M1819_001366 [Sarea resinae]|nr:MAG: hypothetical protein M1819_001366 [Sarea resinae]